MGKCGGKCSCKPAEVKLLDELMDNLVTIAAYLDADSSAMKALSESLLKIDRRLEEITNV